MQTRRWWPGILVGLWAVFAAAVAGCDGGEKAPAPTSASTAPAEERPTALGTPAAVSPPFTLPEGTRVLEVGAPIKLAPDQLIYYGVYCNQCGPGFNLWRAHRDPATGNLVREELLPLRGTYEGKAIHTFAADYAAGNFYAGVCTQGYCGGEGDPSPDAQAVLIHSLDGGITWEDEGALPINDSLTAVVAGEAIIASVGLTGGNREVRSRTHPEGRVLTPPASALWVSSAYEDGTPIAYWLTNEPEQRQVFTLAGQPIPATEPVAGRLHLRPPRRRVLGVVDRATQGRRNPQPELFRQLRQRGPAAGDLYLARQPPRAEGGAGLPGTRRDRASDRDARG